MVSENLISYVTWFFRNIMSISQQYLVGLRVGRKNSSW